VTCGFIAQLVVQAVWSFGSKIQSAKLQTRRYTTYFVKH